MVRKIDLPVAILLALKIFVVFLSALLQTEI